MPYKYDLVCHICKLIVENPISFPCHCIICEKHVFDGEVRKTLIKCETCGDEFKVPDNGFFPNKLALRILEYDAHLTDSEKKIKYSINNVNLELDQMSKQFDLIKVNIDKLCSNHIGKIRQEIETQRNEYINEINIIADSMLEQMSANETNYLKELESIAGTKIVPDIEKLNAIVKQKYREPELELGDVYPYQIEQKQKIASLRSAVKKFQFIKDKIELHVFKSSPKVTFEALETYKQDNFICYTNEMDIKICDLELKNFAVNTLKGHTGKVNCVEKLDVNHIVSGSDDKTIKIWDFRNGICIKTLEDEDCQVDSVICFNGTTLASTSNELIKIWDTYQGKCVETLHGHTGKVSCIVYVENGRLASGSFDRTIKIWDIHDGTCMKTIENVKVLGLCLLENGDLAFSSVDDTIKVWNFESAEIISTLSNDSDNNHDKMYRLYSRNFLPPFPAILARKRDGKLSEEKRYMSHLLQAKNDKLLSIADRSIYVWDLNTKQRDEVSTLTGHDRPISCMKMFKNGTLVSCSINDQIKLWDLAKNECITTLNIATANFALI